MVVRKSGYIKRSTLLIRKPLPFPDILMGHLEGMAKDLDKSGALVLKLDSGEEQTIYSGDCEHLRDAK